MPRDANTTERAKRNRKELTDAETRLWSLLRDRRLAQFRFRRQYGIGPYVADFACIGARLVVEVDGPAHDSAEQAAFDAERTAFLNKAGWRVIRVSNGDVFVNLGVVEGMIHDALNAE